MRTNNTDVDRRSLKTVFRYISAGIFAVVGIFSIICVVYICTEHKDSRPFLTFVPDAPRAQVASFLELVCAGDFTKAEEYLLGTPSMGVETRPEDEISALIWEAFISSTAYELTGTCYTTDDGLAQNVRFSCLDINSITNTLRDRSQVLLKNRVDAAENVSEIYDENNEYRTDVVNEVLRQAVNDSLKEDAKIITTDVTLYLIYRDGQWWVQADQSLMDVLFGDILFYSA